MDAIQEAHYLAQAVMKHKYHNGEPTEIEMQKIKAWAKERGVNLSNYPDQHIKEVWKYFTPLTKAA